MAREKPIINLTKRRQKVALACAIIAIGLLAVGTLTGKMYAGSAVCGNNACEVGETMASCAEDCVSIHPKPWVLECPGTHCVPVCADAVCQPGEELICPQDCVGDAVEAEEETVSLLDGILSFFR